MKDNIDEMTNHLNQIDGLLTDQPQLARTVTFSETGGPEMLNISLMSIPAPAANEVRIMVKAIGLNRAESMWRSGEYIEEPVLPAKLGYDAAGIVEAVGSNVKHVKVGDLVGTIPAFSQNEYGVYGELILMPAHAVIKSPSSLSFEQVAAIWNPFITSYGALIDSAHLHAGQNVLIPAASSSVGLAAIQVANMVGAVPIALTRKNAKKQQLLDAGASFVIATEEEDVVEEVKKITNGHGADVVFDPVGGPLFAKLLKALTRGGQMFLYGALSDKITPLNLIDVLNQVPVIRGHTVWDITKDPERVEKARKFIFSGIASGALKPMIATTFSFENIVEAHRYLESNQQIGKIVVTVD
jgi:NADPH:quinone reductase-like Zn-dependent oxidoreductase